jgi:drug/metabolite transporter (DMT)-like permease
MGSGATGMGAAAAGAGAADAGAGDAGAGAVGRGTGAGIGRERWLPEFVALSAIWGASFALIKVGVDAGLPPVWVALWRCLFGALALLGFCAVLRVRLPRDPVTWAHASVIAALLNSVPFTLLAFGEQRVSSVLAGMLNATTPLATLLFGLALMPAERLTRWRLAGRVFGFLGVACLLGVWRGGALGGATLGGALACLAATLCYGAGFSYTRRWYAGRDGSAAALSALQIGLATVQLALVAPWLAGLPHWPGPPAALAMVVLGALGTGYAYILNLRVIRVAGSTMAASVTYLTPVWSTAIGAWLLSEPVGWNTLLGTVILVAGIALSRRRGKPRSGP